MANRSSIVKLLTIILSCLTWDTIGVSGADTDVEFFDGLESFIPKDTLIFANCSKISKKFEKICTIKKSSNIFNQLSTIQCPTLLKSERNDYVIGPNVKVIPFGNDKAVIQWIEKYDEAPNARKVYIKIAIIKFDNGYNCSKKNFEISLQLKNGENPDEALDKVHVITDKEDNYILIAYYDKFFSENEICRMSVDEKGNIIKELEPWFSLPNGSVKKLVSLKRESTKFGFLAFSDFPHAYLINKDGSVVPKLDIASDAGAKIMHSTDHDQINICYYKDSSFSYGRFTDKGEIISKHTFRLNWDIVDGAVHYIPGYDLNLIFTYSSSKFCKETELQEYGTFINNRGIINSIDLSCRLKNLTMPQIFQDLNNNQHVVFEYAFHMKDDQDQLLSKRRYFAIKKSEGMTNDVFQFVNMS